MTITADMLIRLQREATLALCEAIIEQVEGLEYDRSSKIAAMIAAHV